MMSEEQGLKTCPRCQTGNRAEHNFCWLCGIGFREASEHRDASAQLQTPNTGAAVAKGLVGFLGGAAGGLAIGFFIVCAFVMSVLNAIAEIFDGCAPAMIFISLTTYVAIYSVISWLV